MPSGIRCPVGNDCLKTNVVYKATVQHENKISNYIGMTENSFKTRYTQHKSFLKHSKNRTQTELSSLIWSLKDSSTPYKLAWHIIDQAQPYQPGKRSCNLCLAEKFHILTGEHLINEKTELLNKCPHRRKFLTCNMKLWHHSLLTSLFDTNRLDMLVNSLGFWIFKLEVFCLFYTLYLI